MPASRVYVSRLLVLAILLFFVIKSESAEPAGNRVSFQKEILPIFQANCQGCHQPARMQGGYDLTHPDKMRIAGESGVAAIVPGKPDESELIRQVHPVDGKSAMPKGKAPLSAPDVELIRRWIAEGAVNDAIGLSPAYTMDNPPVYAKPPLITSIDFSPDGKILAVAAFHEVLLVEVESWKTVHRLVGLSERIETVRFSPDGDRLLVTGGQPGRMGEVQIWSVAGQKLLLSVPFTFDTLYGGSWSPDGKLVAFGGSDKIVRAIDSETGEQKFFQGAHEDWVRSTLFIPDGSHIVSAGQDMTVKLTEVATERFIDNITSITPGALRGGVNALASHPQANEILVGGSDGTPKIYRVFRVTERKIGDDANLLRRMPQMEGRIFSLAISREGDVFAAASTVDGKSQVRIWKYDLESALPDDIKEIQRKRVQQQTDEDRKKLEQHVGAAMPLLADLAVSDGSVYALAFGSARKMAYALHDGRIRVVKVDGGELIAEFAPAPQGGHGSLAEPTPTANLANNSTASASSVAASPALTPTEQLPEGVVVSKLLIHPSAIELTGPTSYAQVLVTAQFEGGGTADVTRIAEFKIDGDAAKIDARGVLRTVANGSGKLTATLTSSQAATTQQATAEIRIHGLDQPSPADFIRDVNPVLSRLGCNQGTCHGSAKGKNGFKLSLRGYDPIFDVRAFADDWAGRRTNVAAPEASLMLLKTLGTVPHEGGKLISSGDVYHSILRQWIASGCRLDLEVPRVTKITVSPDKASVPLIGQKQQVRVVATYSDGRTRDVTHEAFIESGNTEVATVDRLGLVTAIRRGEAAVLARYEGAYAATTLTVMGDRDGFQWREPATWGRIDELVAKKWRQMKILPSDLATDHEFIRRVYLDLTGLPPTADQVRGFLADQRPTQEKRNELIDQLIGSEAFIDHWSNKWSDLLQVNSKFLGTEGAMLLRQWIRQQVADNVPYDQFVRAIVTAGGSNKENPAASYFKILRTPQDTMENTTHLFLGVRFNCNKCHDHPFERWTQDQYYQTAAFFSRVGLRRDPASGNRNIGGTAVEGAKPLFEEVFELPQGEVLHERTGKPVEPKFPFSCDFSSADGATRREELGAWLTSRDNDYFARSYVNRLWGYLLGIGLIEPIDDLRAGNPPTNPQLLDHLENEFIESSFDMRYMLRLICRSRTYQLSVATNPWNADDQLNYSHAIPRRLPAEVLYDAIHAVVGAKLKIPGVPEGTRAAALPDVAVNLPDGFLNNLGRPARESACECERSAELQLGPVMALASGPTVGSAIGDQENCLQELVTTSTDRQKIIDDLYMRILNRPATAQEVATASLVFDQIGEDHERLLKLRDERDAWWKLEQPKLEEARLADLSKTEKQLAERIEEIRPERERLEMERKKKIASAETAVKEYEAEKLPAQLTEFLKKKDVTDWTFLNLQALDAGKKTNLIRLADRSIAATGDKDPAIYTITAKSNLPQITALRLEALADAELPSQGPGRADNGNFVVTEVEFSMATADKPKDFIKQTFASAVVDFSQDGFAADQVFDGQEKDQRGWAVSGALGISHWMVLRLKKPLEVPEGALLQVKLFQYHNSPGHRLGRFRLSVTHASGEVPLGLAEEFAAVASTPEGQRTESQKKLVEGYIEKTDAGLRKLQAALATAKQRVPPDPLVVSMERRVAFLKQPTPEDRKLVQLRSDVDQSKQQLDQLQLTAAQDLAWALINSPAFLFNR
jgi:WD40 repeat protein/mono/diheme cytochrome c family protein